MAKILVVNHERSVRNSLKEMLEHEGYQVEVALDSHEALAKNNNQNFDLVMCETPSADGAEDLSKAIHTVRPTVPIMLTSKEPNSPTSKQSMEWETFNLGEKPLNLNKLLVSIKNSMDRSLTPEVELAPVEEVKIQKTRQTRSRVNPIIGESAKITTVKELIDKIAPWESRVLITGANGTGKELVAQWIHEKSNRRNGPFIEVNCAAIPSELIESELFGHEKGAFTSAIKQRKGKFEQADGGTIFLDEIGDMSLSAQAKVLRALQEKKISRVGCDKDITVNVRVLAATNKNLAEEIAKRNFREDLYHRLSVITINVPTLNDRIEDIPILIESFMENICAEYSVHCKEFEPAAIEELMKMNWSGNIRQLRNVVERLIILGGNRITLEDVKCYVST